MRPVDYLAVFIPLAIILKIADAPDTLIFFTASAGVIPTAALMGRGHRGAGHRSGPGIGGLLNVTFGNAPELIIALFALGKGLQEVVKASLVGSIVGNMLLVMGARDAGRRLEARQADVRRARLRQAQSSMLLLAWWRW